MRQLSQNIPKSSTTFKHRSHQCRPKTCPVCFQIFSRRKYYEEHIKKQKIRCNHCYKDYCDESTFQRHIRSLRNITDDTIRDLNQRIYPETGYENEDGYQEVIENKFNEIRDRTRNTKHYKIIIDKLIPALPTAKSIILYSISTLITKMASK